MEHQFQDFSESAVWAFPDNKLDRFKRLLEHGADPNVIIKSDFNTRGGMGAGDSVTHLACKTEFPGYFEAVFENGGDPNLLNSEKGKISNTPLFLIIKHGSAKKDRIKYLIDKGADINHVNGAGKTPTMQAVTWGGQYDIALMLLEAGASHQIYKPDSNSKLIHIVVSEKKRRSATWTAQQKADYRELVKWLEERGVSVDEANIDIERWASWVGTPAEKAKLRRQEIAERRAREQATVENAAHE